MSDIRQKQKKCRTCKALTLHVATLKKMDMGCGFVAGNLFLCVITVGLWLPIFIFILGVGMFGNSLAPFGAKYRCQVCGRVN